MNRLVVNEIVYANRKGIKSSLPKETCWMDEGGGPVKNNHQRGNKHSGAMGRRVVVRRI